MSVVNTHTRMVLGDWGVSSCRLFLLENGEISERRNGPGVKFTTDLAEAFHEMVSDWGKAPALLCGTVGANIGWKDAGYVDTPATLESLAGSAVEVSGSHVRILPGVRTPSNRFGTADVMRSEEIQAFGWCKVAGRHEAKLCLPGSHTKWVEVCGNAVDKFTTGFAGELFEVLSSHSTLIGGPDHGASGTAFKDGVRVAEQHPSHLAGLFHVRALAAQNLEGGKVSRERLSGYIIGADCVRMLETWQCPPDAIIGDGHIATAYQSALATLGHEVDVASGEASVLEGLRLAMAVTS